jgi:hypothetical protein
MDIESSHIQEISIAVVKKQGFLGKWAAAT